MWPPRPPRAVRSQGAHGKLVNASQTSAHALGINLLVLLALLPEMASCVPTPQMLEEECRETHPYRGTGVLH